MSILHYIRHISMTHLLSQIMIVLQLPIMVTCTYEIAINLCEQSDNRVPRSRLLYRKAHMRCYRRINGEKKELTALTKNTMSVAIARPVFGASGRQMWSRSQECTTRFHARQYRENCDDVHHSCPPINNINYLMGVYNKG